jgi:NitT/TauT family transport system substrate-binding protein
MSSGPSRAAALGSIAAALVAGATRPARGDDLSPIAIGTTPIDAGAQPYYAQSQGFFKSAGIGATITALSNGAELAAAVASGALDIGQSNVVSIATARERGIPFVIVAPASLYSSKVPQSALIVAATSPIRTAKDFEGKTVAVSGLKTISQLGPEVWIDKNGGDVASVKFIEMPFSAMNAALAQGRVDAALISEPELSGGLAGGGERLVANAYDAIAREFLIGAWFTTTTWAAAHPDLLRRYVAAMAQTARWANAHHADTARILEAESHVPVSPLAKRVVYGETLDAGLIQPLLDASLAYGILKQRVAAADLIAR